MSKALSALPALFGVMSARQRRLLVVTLALMLLGAAAELGVIGAVVPFLLLVTSGGASAIPEAIRNILTLVPGGLLVGTAVLLSVAGLIVALVRLLLLWVSQKLVVGWASELARRVFSRILRQPYSAYLDRNSSEYLSAFEKVYRLMGAMLQPMLQGVIAVILALCIATLLFAVDPLAASITGLSLAAAYGLLNVLTRRQLARNSFQVAQEMTERNRLVREALGGIRDVLLDSSQPVLEERFAEIEARAKHAMAQNAFLAGAPRFVLESVGVIVLAFVAVVLSGRPGGIVAAIPTLGVLALGAQRLLPLLQQAWVGWIQVSANAQLAVDVADLLMIKVEATGEGEGSPLLFQRTVELDRISFVYASGMRALDDVSLTIDRGERIGIEGPTGSGKSTLIDMIMGFLEPTEGRMSVDGHVLDAAARRQWRLNIAHVSQSVYLGDDSIAANLSFGTRSPADAERMRAAIDAAQLGSFVDSLPEGMATRVGERGSRWSGGQRQRLAIARALYRAAPVLVLDEATSALDAATESKLIEALERLDRTITMIIVSHRASILSVCDRVITLEDGRIGPAVSNGSPKQPVRPISSKKPASATRF